MRLLRSLSGHWSFQLDPEGTLQCQSIQPDRQIPVPLPMQAAFPELQRYGGYAWYRTTFDLNAEWLAGELLLHFGAVDYWCEVYLNDTCVGTHEGGYTAFEFPVRQFVHEGENTLTVRVYDTPQTGIKIPRWRDGVQPDRTQPPFDPELIPHGKQTWYLDASGIWQDVTLTAVPARYVDAVRITPDIHTGEARVHLRLGGASQPATVAVTIAGQTVEADVASDQAEVTLSVIVPQPALWTPETPTLYTADIRLQSNGGEDQLSETFGFREIGTRDGMLLLNGEPLYLLCALDQDMYPDTIYTVPSDDFLRDQFRKAKELGLNSLRCHIKPPDPRYLEFADEIGLLVWAEIPSWRTFHQRTTTHESAIYLDDAVKARARRTLEEMIARDYNHPSLIIWTIVNEDWGTSLLLSESDRAWIAQMYDHCKQLDPTRLVVDNSPCPASWGLSVHVKSDLDDFHIYTNIPDSADQFEQFVDQLALRPLWSFSNTGDAQRTGKEPIILSEFGNWALPTLKQYNGVEPDWFQLGGWWSPFDGEPTWPMGVLDRFSKLGLDRLWSDYDTFAEATQWHGFNALKYEIENLRRLPQIQGYVITELSDIYWESNGLLDFTRGTKVFHQRAAEINSPDMVIPHLRRYAYWDGETARVKLYASHYSGADWSDVTARASVDGRDVFNVQITAMQRGTVRELGAATWQFPTLDSSRMATMTLAIENGSPLANSQISVLVLPAAAQKPNYKGEVAVITRPEKHGIFSDIAPTTTPNVASTPQDATLAPEAEEVGTSGMLRKAMHRLGYHTTSKIGADTRLIVTDYPSAEMLQWVRAGGDMLFLSSLSASPFFWRHGRGGSYSGNWATSFSWLRPEVFPRLHVNNPLSLPFMDVIPLAVILGLPVEDAAVHEDFLAGQISGWLRLPAVHTVQFRYGRGRVIMTMYRLFETMRYHPIAVAMLHDLIEHLTSDACQPVLQANY